MYEIFEKLLEQYNVTAYRVGKETGIPASTFSDWKKGKSKPKNEKLQKIADFFDVSVDYLMTGEHANDTPGYYLNEETASIAQDIFENKELRILFDAARDATPEDLETVHSMLIALKRKERGVND